MTAIERLNIIYDNEINCSISSFFDGGTLFQIGDEQNGFKVKRNFYNLEEGFMWLYNEAKRLYPKGKWK